MVLEDDFMPLFIWTGQRNDRASNLHTRVPSASLINDLNLLPSVNKKREN